MLHVDVSQGLRELLSHGERGGRKVGDVIEMCL